MLTTINDLCPHQMRLSGNWEVCPIPLDTDGFPQVADTFAIPECTHLQLVLYPDRPYWGDHLRAINEQAWVYQRSFTLPDKPFQRVRLRFDGVDYFAAVWINGQFIGEHEGHFSSFDFDITDAVSPTGENTLTVRVSSPWDPPNPNGSYPTDHVIRGLVKGLYEHGEGVIPPNVNPLGIWRPVWLLLDAGVSLDHIQIQTQMDGTVALQLTATNATQQEWNGTLNLHIEADNHTGAGVNTVLPVRLPVGTQKINQTMQIPDPQLWWPWDHGEPNLYCLTATLCDENDEAIATQNSTFGVREVELERAPDHFTYRINGREVFLRGSSYMPGLYLSQCDRDMLARDVALAREANLNVLRVHVHVSPLELYDLCDRSGILIWQDFELNWIHDPSPEFEARAVALQHDMIATLGNHPSIITWICYNEPTMVFTRRHNLEQRPAPALYAAARQQDSTRPVFLCSGQMETDWEQAGDAHTYYGAFWTKHYTDVYRHRFRLHTEFGVETPAALETLQQYPDAWEHLQHLDGQIEELWAYQAELIQFHTEHLRRLRAEGCAGYIHFWLADLVPQVGCGILDAARQRKGGYAALQRASQPLHIALEHDGRQPRAIWIFNDTPKAYANSRVSWRVQDSAGNTLLHDEVTFNIDANATQQVLSIDWSLTPAQCERIDLILANMQGNKLAHNTYEQPFKPMPRPKGYPWKFDPYLGCKVFDRPGAPSLADQSGNPIIKLVPLSLREQIAEWALRQQLPPQLLKYMSRIVDLFNS